MKDKLMKLLGTLALFLGHGEERRGRRLLLELGFFLFLALLLFLFLGGRLSSFFLYSVLLMLLIVSLPLLWGFSPFLRWGLLLLCLILGAIPSLESPQKDITGFRLDTPAGWVVQDQTGDDMIHFVQESTGASVMIWYSALSPEYHRQDPLDYGKVAQSGDAVRIMDQDRIQLGEWSGTRLFLDPQISAGGRSAYRLFYLLDIPGSREIMVQIGALGKQETEALGAVWEKLLPNLELIY